MCFDRWLRRIESFMKIFKHKLCEWDSQIISSWFWFLLWFELADLDHRVIKSWKLGEKALEFQKWNERPPADCARHFRHQRTHNRLSLRAPCIALGFQFLSSKSPFFYFWSTKANSISIHHSSPRALLTNDAIEREQFIVEFYSHRAMTATILWYDYYQRRSTSVVQKWRKIDSTLET